MQLGISVVICCYNSSQRISDTLTYIADQKLSGGFPVEVILVNNASSDDTAEVATNAWNALNSKIHFKIVDEAVPGLSIARERGLHTAQYAYVIFVDDDNWLQDTYIELVYEIMGSDERIAILGGRGEAVCEINPPFWFDRCKEHYVVGAPFPNSADITTTKAHIYGAGMVIRKSSWLKLKHTGYVSVLADRKGNTLSSGGDVELCNAMRLLKYKIFYDERLVFKHFIPKERLQWEYLVKLFPKFAEAEVFLQCFQHFEVKYFDDQSELKHIYLQTLKEIFKRVAEKKKDVLLLYLYGIPEGKRSYLFLKFSLVQLRILILKKNKFLSYLNYLNSFKKYIVEGRYL